LNKGRLISCHDCGQKISKLALVCPYCGLPIPALRPLFSPYNKWRLRVENSVAGILGFGMLVFMAYMLVKWVPPLVEWLLDLLPE